MKTKPKNQAVNEPRQRFLATFSCDDSTLRFFLSGINKIFLIKFDSGFVTFVKSISFFVSTVQTTQVRASVLVGNSVSQVKVGPNSSI
jgi:hypothetical protein